MLTDQEIQAMVRACSPMAGRLGTACLPIVRETGGDKDHGLRCALGFILLGIAFCKTARVSRGALLQIVGEVFDHSMVIENKPGSVTDS
jgi:hypothetical protein